VDLFRESSGREVNIHITKQSSTRFTLNYMCKYISANKDDFKTDLDMANYIFTSRKRRLIHTFGDFYKIKIISRKEICPNCKQSIEYILDFEIVSIIEEQMIKPPSPQNVIC
jgi:hypothetical protein